jgi:DNA-binding transcriptional MerR regulator
MYGISKSTLFRWEKDEILNRPARRRNVRRYFPRDITEVIARHQLSRRFEAARDLGEVAEMLENSARNKLLAGDLCGLHELAEMPRISAVTIRTLLEVALRDFQPGSAIFSQMLSVASRHSRTLAPGCRP